jgi:hypothetical protein
VLAMHKEYILNKFGLSLFVLTALLFFGNFIFIFVDLSSGLIAPYSNFYFSLIGAFILYKYIKKLKFTGFEFLLFYVPQLLIFYIGEYKFEFSAGINFYWRRIFMDGAFNDPLAKVDWGFGINVFAVICIALIYRAFYKDRKTQHVS